MADVNEEDEDGEFWYNDGWVMLCAECEGDGCLADVDWIDEADEDDEDDDEEDDEEEDDEPLLARWERLW